MNQCFYVFVFLLSTVLLPTLSCAGIDKWCNLQLLATHAAQKLADKRSNSKSKPLLVCDKCGAYFTRAANLRMHRQRLICPKTADLKAAQASNG